jgi:hypothetical protein
MEQEIKYRKLRRFNIIMGFFHLVQGTLMFLLSSDFTLPITSSFQVFDSAANKLVPLHDTLVDLQIGPVVAAFLFLSAIAHFSVILPGGWNIQLAPH